MSKHFVDFLETTDSGQEVVATIAVNGGLVVPVGDGRPPDVAEMVDLIQRIPGCEGVTPADGDKFLEALHFAYGGSRFQATEPYEVPGG